MASNQSLNADDPDNLGKKGEMPCYKKLVFVNNVTETISMPSAMDFILIKVIGFCKCESFILYNYTMYK